MLRSVSENTLKQYNSSFFKWWNFCKNKTINIFRPSLNNLLNFLTFEFSKGASYQTLNCHRSALKMLFDVEDRNNIIKKFLRGTFRIKPVFPKYNDTWDPKMVLNYLSGFFPLSTLDFKELTYKLITLMSLITSQRIQTFSLLKITDIKKDDDSIIIITQAFLKSSAPNRPQPVLKISYFNKEKPELCVASTLVEYIERTGPLRGEVEELFITHKKPFHKATTQTLSRWIKIILEKAGVDTTRYSAYSTRHASTSAAFRKGIDIESIRKVAGWSPDSNMFARFYCRPLIDKDAYAKVIISHR